MVWMRAGGQWASSTEASEVSSAGGGGSAVGDHVGRPAGGVEGDAPVRVARGEGLVLEPRDRRWADPRDGAQRVDRPVREALRQVNRRVRPETGDRRLQLAPREVQARGARCAAASVVVVERHRERRVAKDERHRRGGRLERHVDAPHAVERAGLLQVRHGRHQAVGGLLGAVLRALAGEVERGHALLVAVGACREAGVRAADDQRVVVPEGGVGQVVRVEDLDHVPLERDAHAAAPDVAGVFARPPGEEEHVAAQHDVAEHAPRRLPPDVLG